MDYRGPISTHKKRENQMCFKFILIKKYIGFNYIRKSYIYENKIKQIIQFQ